MPVILDEDAGPLGHARCNDSGLGGDPVRQLPPTEGSGCRAGEIWAARSVPASSYPSSSPSRCGSWQAHHQRQQLQHRAGAATEGDAAYAAYYVPRPPRDKRMSLPTLRSLWDDGERADAVEDAVGAAGNDGA